MILTDLDLWDASTTALRREAAAAVDRHARDFAFDRLETFEAGGQRREVALFVHEGTGMGFALIPSGRFLMGSPVTERGRDCDELQRAVGSANDAAVRIECEIDDPGQIVGIVRRPGCNPPVHRFVMGRLAIESFAAWSLAASR